MRAGLFATAQQAWRSLQGRGHDPQPAVVRLVDGKLEPPYSCEVIAAYQCNISCARCNQASPIRHRGYADPTTVRRDFSLLASVYRASVVKIVGGEPLLHPDLPAVIRALRQSGISKKVLLLTNGMLLSRMTEETWRLLDAIEVSVYPDSGLDDQHMRTWTEAADRHGVALRFVRFDRFRVTFSRSGTQDEDLVRRVYRTCRLAHVWGCQNIHQGYFYKCVQSIHVPAIVGAPPESARQDGIRLTDDPGLRDELYRYLHSPQPLHACRHCLGVAGRLEDHHLVDRAQWLSGHDAPTEHLLDYERLRGLEAGQDFDFAQGVPIALATPSPSADMHMATERRPRP